ncbi:hypothetical protein OF122_03615 [Pelagibacterium flavum]|uniref:Reverse transcriptase domain-containing protein n=1 Tax=Pelagibacterium flavum TaxID=2984530 RepID=A0ABY6IQH8_9HYPH|nr:reverse transcriptase domain-containing protein [Pelagibacterium sp. YIM 151497]UYQ72874.1 hypothetical protein OF122_03615 [Pelagibacterium sp. YIM 151497]
MNPGAPRPSNLDQRARFAIRQAYKQTGRLIESLRKNVERGKHGKAMQKQRVLMRSRAAKLVALHMANRRLKPKYRVHRTFLVELADQLDVWQADDEIVRLKIEKKEGGRGYRPILSFGLRHKARQYLCVMALRPFIEPHLRPTQFERLGRDRAALEIADRFVEGSAKFALECDIREFYLHVGAAPDGRLRRGMDAATAISEWLPLPTEVILSTVLADTFNIVDNVHTIPRTDPVSLTFLSRAGIPQGSPLSSAIAEFIVALLLTDAVALGDCKDAFISYADNIAVLGNTKHDVKAVQRTLERSLERCSYGYFRLKHPYKKVRRYDHGFDFLGFQIRKRRGTTNISPSEKARKKFQERTKQLVKLTRTSSWVRPERREAAVLHLLNYLRSWTAAHGVSEHIDAYVYRSAIQHAGKINPVLSTTIRSECARRYDPALLQRWRFLTN